MFKITPEIIDENFFNDNMTDDRAGGIVRFEGRVRNHNEGYEVKSLEYQAYAEMALKEGQVIVDEAREKFEVFHTYCVHRVGHLNIGEMAVLVTVSAKHRKEAFVACEYIIDQVKLRVPVWKKEYYVNKKPEWVACHRCMTGDEHHKSEIHEHG